MSEKNEGRPKTMAFNLKLGQTLEGEEAILFVEKAQEKVCPLPKKIREEIKNTKINIHF